MGTTKPEIKNLGAKHKYYNEVIKEAISNNHTDVSLENKDVNILAQIEIESHKRNVEYILDVFKSDDLLYVSRAIKKCTWLITDNSYAHIIDPDHLKLHLYPMMTSKAKNKLHKHIRNNIKDELRAEMFYHAEDTIDAALKWLPSCSIPFIESKIVKHYEKIKKTRLFKRLCERSIYILDLIEDNCISEEKIEAVKFIQKKDVSLFLKTIDRLPTYTTLKLNKKTTKLLMVNCPNNIIENFYKYSKHLDILTFSKYLKPHDVKDFIYKLIGLETTYRFRFTFKSEDFEHLVQRLPKEERFDFVNKVFIEQIHKTADIFPESEKTKMTELFIRLQYFPKYVWYKYAPFEVAFNEMKQCSSNKKYDFLKILIKYSCRNQSDLQSILEYYCDKHNNDSSDSKICFIDDLLKESNFCFYDDKTWSILNDIFKSLNVYSESKNISDKYIEIVIVHKLIKNEPVQEELEDKFMFNNTFKRYRNKLKPDEQLRIFSFIFNYVFRKTNESNKVENEEQFDTIIKSLINVLEILNDWDKELVDFPIVLKKIKYLVRMKTVKSWNADLSHLYNVKKSWKQLMFEESFILEPSEKVCINALKHDPGLLERYEDKLIYLACNSKMYLKVFLKKVRIYFSESITKKFINKNLLRLDQPDDHNIVIRNLCTVMEQEEILKVINKYVPKEAKINWDEEEGLTLSIRRYIAKNMHYIRPHPSPDVILAYAKGDYLQYAVPSVLAIFYNMKPLLFQKNVLKLFNSPVSLQKLSIRLAITKMDYDDLVKDFYNVWTNTKNTSIRSIIFQLTFKLLCRQKKNDEIINKKIWNLLEMFIDNLTFKEDKSVYTLMYKTDGIPHTIKANFIEKNHMFLDSYLAQADSDLDQFERYQMEERLIIDSTDVMENMNEDFMFRALEKLIDLKFFCKSPHAKQPHRRYINPCDGFISVLSVFLLCSKDEKEQESKYKSILLPILQRALGKLNEEYRWKENIKTLLDYLRINLDKYALKNKMVIPLKMFSIIYEELVKSLNVTEYYFLITQWRLTMEFVKHLHTTNQNNENDNTSLDTERFGCKCIEILKEDVKNHFPRIYLIFHKILYDTLKDLCSDEERIKIFINMLSDKDFIPGYLTIIKIAATYIKNNRTWDEILQILRDHPSLEVNMNYYYYFNEYDSTALPYHRRRRYT